MEVRLNCIVSIREPLYLRDDFIYFCGMGRKAIGVKLRKIKSCQVVKAQ